MPKLHKYDMAHVKGIVVFQVYASNAPADVLAVCPCHLTAQKVVDALNNAADSKRLEVTLIADVSLVADIFRRQ